PGETDVHTSDECGDRIVLGANGNFWMMPNDHNASLKPFCHAEKNCVLEFPKNFFLSAAFSAKIMPTCQASPPPASRQSFEEKTKC
ncbi:MAG TPA: hypothetical protein VKE98_21835, partial [Gemmataceae bacterium]|nr:hypothetical protein [Gemmataceae bacterium]